MKYFVKAFFVLVLIIIAIFFIEYFSSNGNLNNPVKKSDKKEPKTKKYKKVEIQKIVKPSIKVSKANKPKQPKNQNVKKQNKKNPQDTSNQHKTKATKTKPTKNNISKVSIIKVSDWNKYEKIVSSIQTERKDKKLKFSVSWEVISDNDNLLKDIYTKYFFMRPFAKVNNEYYSLDTNPSEILSQKDIKNWPMYIVSDNIDEWQDVIKSKNLENVRAIYYLATINTASTFITKLNTACECLLQNGIIKKSANQNIIIRGRIFGFKYKGNKIATYLPTEAIINGKKFEIPVNCFDNSADISLLKRMGLLE